MAINAELQKWLAEKVQSNLSPEEAQTFTSILSKEAVAEQLNRAWMAPPDYNRKMDELKQKESMLNAELQNHIASLNQWRDGEQGRVSNQVAQLQAQYDRDVAVLRAQLEGEGFQPSVAQPAKAAAAVAPTNGNGNGHYSQQDIQKMVQAELSKAAMLPAVTMDIAERHRAMFGQIPDMAKVTDTAIRTGRSLNDTWREMYKVADKEAEIQQADIQKRINDGIQEGLTKALAEGAMNQQNFSGRPEQPSVIRQMLTRKQEADGNSPLATPQPVMQQSEGVNQAIELLRSGKFAVKYPGQT